MVTLQKTISGHSGAIYCAKFHDSFIYSGSADKFITRWNLSDGSQDKFAIKFEQSIYQLAVTNSDILWVGLSNGSVHVFDLNNKIEIKHFTQHTKPIFCIKYNSFNNQIYCTDSDGNLSVWSAKNQKLIIYLPFDCGKIRNISLNNTGDKFLMACQDGVVRKIDANTFNEEWSLKIHQDSCNIALFHPKNENLILSAGKDAHIKLTNIVTQKIEKSIPAHNFGIYTIQFLNETQFISCSLDKSIKYWDLNSFAVIQKITAKEKGHLHAINGIELIDSNSFLTYSDDKKIKIWNVKVD